MIYTVILLALLVFGMLFAFYQAVEASTDDAIKRFIRVHFFGKPIVHCKTNCLAATGKYVIEKDPQGVFYFYDRYGNLFHLVLNQQGNIVARQMGSGEMYECYIPDRHLLVSGDATKQFAIDVEKIAH